MRDPENRPATHGQSRAEEGGKAAGRLRQFQEARGITASIDPSAAGYATGVAAAIAAAAAAPAAGAAGAANLPQWHFVGPDLVPNGQTYGAGRVPVSGRVGAIAVDPSNSGHILCGSAGGGVWESFSMGADWAPRTDFMPTLTIGAVAFSPGNSSVVYAGTGEGNFYSFLGQGILRSTDGGTTWAVLAAGAFVGQGFFRIIVDPANGQHILAATSGGVYESADGGVTWAQVLAGQTWEISMQSAGGPASEVLAATTGGLQRSTNGGHTWAAQALPGAPAGNWTRLAVSIAPSDGSTAFAFGVSGNTAYLWVRSGGTWSAVGTPAGMNISQAWYDWYVATAPDNTTQVYLGAIDAYRGDLASGNWTWTDISTKAAGVAGSSIHPDQHMIAFDPANPSVIYCGCDGGLFRSPDRGVNWTALNCGLGITEVEYMVNNNSPGNTQWLLAGTQDNGSIRCLGTSAFEHVADGDGGDCGIDQGNPATCYHSYYNMGMERSTASGAWQTFQWIGPNVPQGYNSLFYPPMAANGATVAQAGQSVFISRDHGTTWTETPLPAGVTATALSAPTTDWIYVATQTGRIFSTSYTNGAWAAAVELTSPRAANISAIVTDTSIGNRLWVTMSQTGGGQVWRSNDAGNTWNNQTGTLPELPYNSIAVDPANSSRVWVSADVGVYQSLDAGATWSAFYQNLPNVLVEDLEFQPAARVLRAATRNRGVWEVAVDVAGSSVLPQGLRACSALLNIPGGQEAFVVGTDRALYHIYQSGPSTGWSGWALLGGTFTQAPVAAANADGHLEVFARGTDGTLWHLYQSPPTYGWSAWNSLGGFVTGNPVVARNADGRLEVFARGPDGALYHNWQTAANSSTVWSGWSSLGGVVTATPAVGVNADGRLEAFARGNDGSLMHNYQSAAGSAAWSGWSSLGGALTSAATVTSHTDGRLEAFARATDGTLWHIGQTAANSTNTWSGGSLGGALVGNPVVARNQNGQLDVFARQADNTLWHTVQDGSTASGWSAWTSLGGSISTDQWVSVNTDGRLEVFARGTDNALWHVYQQAPNTNWSAWQSLGGGLLAFP
jgi:repeat uncharacterized protein DUF346